MEKKYKEINMSQDGLAYTSMFADRSNNFGIGASDYVSTPTNLRLSNNLNDYVSNFGRYTDMKGVTTGNMPSKASFDAVDVTKAPAVFNEKGLYDWSLNEAGKGGSTGGGLVGPKGSTASASFGNPTGYSTWLEGMGIDAATYQGYSPGEQVAIGESYANLQTPESGGFMKFLGSDTAKNAIGVGGLALSAFGALNTYKAGKQAKKQWEAENARANEIMAMNREKYNTYKADKAKLNAGYSGLAASGDK